MSLKIIKKDFLKLSVNELYQIFDLRNRVFIMEQRIMYVDTDFYDQHATHYFMMDQDKIVSYLRLVHPGIKYKEYAITRVATDQSYRHKKLATQLVIQAIEDVKSMNIRLSGQAYLKPYYEKLGFEVVHGPYIEEGIDHYEMLFTKK